MNRSTVHRWRNDPGCLANLNQHRSEAREAQHDRLASLAFSAIEVVKEAFEAGDVRTSLVVLRGVGLIDGRHAPSDLRMSITYASTKRKQRRGSNLASALLRSETLSIPGKGAPLVRALCASEPDRLRCGLSGCVRGGRTRQGWPGFP